MKRYLVLLAVSASSSLMYGKHIPWAGRRGRARGPHRGGTVAQSSKLGSITLRELMERLTALNASS